MFLECFIILNNVIDTILFYRISIQCLWKNEESHITCLLEWSDDYEQVGIHFERNPILWFLAFFASVFTEERYVAILRYSNNSHQILCMLFKAILILVVSRSISSFELVQHFCLSQSLIVMLNKNAKFQSVTTETKRLNSLGLERDIFKGSVRLLLLEINH